MFIEGRHWCVNNIDLGKKIYVLWSFKFPDGFCLFPVVCLVHSFIGNTLRQTTCCKNRPDWGRGVRSSTWNPGKELGSGNLWRRPVEWKLEGRGTLHASVDLFLKMMEMGIAFKKMFKCKTNNLFLARSYCLTNVVNSIKYLVKESSLLYCSVALIWHSGGQRSNRPS